MASLSPSPKMQFFTANGVPLAGGKLYTYVAGGLVTPQTTFTDSTGGTPNTNPIILDSRGEANVWLSDGLLYAFKLTDSLDSLIWTVDNISGQLTPTSLHSVASKTTPVDADEIPLLDSAASFALKKLTWANLKTTLSSTFAALAGSATQVFSAAAATLASHVVRADQVQSRSVTAFTTGGTGTAFTLTPTPAIAAYAANQTFDVIFHAACGVSPTLQISGLATPPNLVRQNLDGSYANCSGSFPAGWQSKVKLVSPTQALVMQTPRRIFAGTLTRDLTAASGSVATTGVGFKPNKIKFYTRIAGTLTGSIGEGSNAGSVAAYTTSVGGSDNISPSFCIYTLQGVGANQTASIGSLDADGFTLAWTKTGSPTGTLTIAFVAEE